VREVYNVEVVVRCNGVSWNRCARGAGGGLKKGGPGARDSGIGRARRWCLVKWHTTGEEMTTARGERKCPRTARGVSKNCGEKESLRKVQDEERDKEDEPTRA